MTLTNWLEIVVLAVVVFFAVRLFPEANLMMDLAEMRNYGKWSLGRVIAL